MSKDLESQREEIRETARKAGYDVSDPEATPTDAMLDAINAGEVDTVITWDSETKAPKTHKLGD